MSNDFFVFRDELQSQFYLLPDKILVEELAPAKEYFRLPADVVQTGFVLERSMLNERDRELVDDGDRTPGLLYYWASLAAAIKTTAELYPVALVVPHKQSLVPLDVDTWMFLLSGEDFEWRPGVVLAIGIDGPIKWKPKWPLDVSGIIFPAFKSGVICQATGPVYKALQKFLPQPDK